MWTSSRLAKQVARRVVRNLVTNAVKFTPAGEAVSVNIHPATADEEAAISEGGRKPLCGSEDAQLVARIHFSQRRPCSVRHRHWKYPRGPLESIRSLRAVPLERVADQRRTLTYHRILNSGKTCLLNTVDTGIL